MSDSEQGIEKVKILFWAVPITTMTTFTPRILEVLWNLGVTGELVWSLILGFCMIAIAFVCPLIGLPYVQKAMSIALD